MKKILLASTMLVGTAGFAAADVSFTGRAYTGLAYNMTTSTLTPDLYAMFTAGMMTTTDGGLEAGASVTVLAAGQNFQKDPTDAQFGGNDWPPAAGVVLGANVYLSGSWGKVAVAYDTNADGDATTLGDQDITVTYTNTWGNFGLTAFGVLVAPGSTATTNGDAGVKGEYTFGNYAVWAAVERDASDADGNKIDLKAGASASLSGFTAEVNAKFDIGTGFTYGGAVGYATGPYSVSAFLSNDLVGGFTPDYGVSAAYDLGGGVAIEAGYAHSGGVNSPAANAVFAGVSMKF